MRRLPVEQLSGVRRIAFGAMVAGAIGIAYAYLSAFADAFADAFASASVLNIPIDASDPTWWPAVARAVATSGPWVMAVSLPVCLVAVMTLGAVRHGRGLGALFFPFALVLMLVSGGFIVALSLPEELASGRLILGLPLRAAVIIYGVGLLPLFVLPIAYAMTFDRVTLTDDDVNKIRAIASANVQAQSTVDVRDRV